MSEAIIGGCEVMDSEKRAFVWPDLALPMYVVEKHTYSRDL